MQSDPLPGIFHSGEEATVANTLSAVEGAVVGVHGRSALLSDEVEARLFWRLRRRIALTSLRQLLATARLRLGLAVGLSLFFWAGLFWLFLSGFEFLQSISVRAEPMVFSLFYSSLMVMLVFSTGIILYGGLFANREIAFLLATPARVERIFIYKFQEAVLYGSWGFLLLGSPLLAAYGVAVGASWHFYALLFPYMIAFVFIPAGIGAIGCLLIVRYLTRFRRVVFLLMCVTLLIAAMAVGWTAISSGRDRLLSYGWFDEIRLRFEQGEHRLLPSWWLREGLMEAARTSGASLNYQPWAQSLLFLALLVSNAMLIHQIAVVVAARVLREGYSRLQTAGTKARRSGAALIDRVVAVGLAPLPATTRFLLDKDFRILRRDPAQWSQFLIFFALVLLYFVNVQRLNYDGQFAVWVNAVGFLNLGVVGLILSTFTTRFIFPMVSLEGRRFWVLGLLPVSRDTILWGKFLFAALGSTLPCGTMILLSDVMLGITPLVIVVHQVTCVLLCVGLSAIAVGLGAKMPDLRETNPSKIAAGFGGTLNLVLSALYIAGIVVLVAVPCHLYIAEIQYGQRDLAALAWLRFAVLAASVAGVVIGLVVTVLSLRMGLRSFRRMEF